MDVSGLAVMEIIHLKTQTTRYTTKQNPLTKYVNMCKYFNTTDVFYLQEPSDK